MEINACELQKQVYVAIFSGSDLLLLMEDTLRQKAMACISHDAYVNMMAPAGAKLSVANVLTVLWVKVAWIISCSRDITLQPVNIRYCAREIGRSVTCWFLYNWRVHSLTHITPYGISSCIAYIISHWISTWHDDVIKPVLVNSPHKGQWRGALMFTLIWINGWVNNHEAGDLRRFRGHYDVSVMALLWFALVWFSYEFLIDLFIYYPLH